MGGLYWIIFALSLVILLLVALIIYLMRRKTTKHNIWDLGLSYDNLCKILKTGDIILFESMENGSLYGNTKHFIISSVLGIKYKHSGIVLKHGGQLYLIECCRYTQAGYWLATYMNENNYLIESEQPVEDDLSKRPGGVRIIKLDDIIREYRKEYRGRFCVKLITQEIPSHIILQELDKYTKVRFADMHNVLFKGVVDLFFSMNNNNPDLQDSMVCSQFTHKLLSDCNVVKNKISSDVFWPYYYYNGKFDELAIIKYSNPITFIY